MRTLPGQLSIEQGLETVRARICTACDRAGRDPAGVRLIGVTKTVPAEDVLCALRAGLQDIGENYVQEAAAKKTAIGDQAPNVRWHLVGRLQSNKVKAALGTFDTIQAIDSVHLAEVLSRRCTQPFGVLLEVNVTQEGSKSGFGPDEVGAAVRDVARLPNLDLRGLMTVAPAVMDPEDVRPVFKTLRQLAGANGLRELSMGMTGDFEIAIEEGATMVRVGRAIFGERA